MMITKLRRISQGIGIPTFIILFFFIPGWWGIISLFALIFGSALILGRVFCSWLCPIGTFEELVGGKAYKQLTLPARPACRFGCPFIWITGWLNKISLITIKVDKDKCIKCGICGDVCLTRLPEQGAGWQKNRNPANDYSCIRCGTCIDACPKQALSYAPRWWERRLSQNSK